MKTIKTFFFIFTFFGVMSFSFAQTRSAGSIYLEIGGNALIYSINYDRLLSNNFGLRAGAMAFALSDGSGSAAAVATPVLANYFIGDGNGRFELGAGIVFASGGIGGGDVGFAGSGVGVTSTIGYRLQPVSGGFLFRIGFTPIYFSRKFIPMGGLSLGYTF